MRHRARSDDLRAALVELVVAFPVYRTYGTAAGLTERDSALLESTGEEARTRLGDAKKREALTRVLGLLGGAIDGSDADEFRRRFQQLTGPLMAKSSRTRCSTAAIISSR